MNAQACASSGRVTDWNAIDWKKAEAYVKKLQMRIVKAQRAGHYNRIKSLQWLLTHSFYAKALAVKRVTSNQGKKTPGVDHELWLTPQAKLNAVDRLKRRGYQPSPLRRVYIPKKNGKMRPLSIPTMKDRAMQTLYNYALQPIAETTADPNSYGFRIGRGTHDAIEQCFTDLNKGKSPVWILEGDIKGCFDHISHEWLLQNIPMDKAILGKWLRCGFVETRKLFPTTEGTPQGGTISPTLMNMTLDGLERKLREHFPKRKTVDKKTHFCKVNYVRYADDFIITGESKELLQEQVLPVVRAFMRERGLQLSEEKTVITHIDDGFDFLGQNVRKYKGKLLIKPSKKAIKTFLAKVRKIIKGSKSATQEQLIRRLNPVIRGWVNYHRYVVSSEVFSSVDYQIYKCLWQWAKRRHKHKGHKWIARRYWHHIKNRVWTFATVLNPGNQNTNATYLQLVYATNTKIIRFHKIVAEANPFDDRWTGYYEEREGEKLLNSTKGREKLLAIWHAQKHACPICGEKITTDTGFRTHVVSLNEYSRRTSMVHPLCHRRLHDKDYLFELGVSYNEMPYEKREPYEVKLSRTVLRGGSGSNADLLPDQTVENKQKFISQIMTSKSPVRSCEDVDETALSYAEIKALCAGDPAIREKMDLDIDVARLRLMKADHLSRQYRLEDQVLKYFPLQIEQCQANIAGFQADMRTLAEHPVPEKSFVGMEANGRLLTDKEAAGQALLNACKDAAQAGHAVQFGSYRGLTMSMDYDSFSNLFYLTLRGQMSHRVELSSSPLGNLVRIENALSAIPDRLVAAQAEMENQRQQMEAAKAEMKKPFPQEEELKTKSARLAELDAQLDMDGASAVPEQEKPSIREALKEPGRRSSRRTLNHEEVVR